MAAAATGRSPLVQTALPNGVAPSCWSTVPSAVSDVSGAGAFARAVCRACALPTQFVNVRRAPTLRMSLSQQPHALAGCLSLAPAPLPSRIEAKQRYQATTCCALKTWILLSTLWIPSELASYLPTLAYTRHIRASRDGIRKATGGRPSAPVLASRRPTSAQLPRAKGSVEGVDAALPRSK